jgi:hypothetical protein
MLCYANWKVGTEYGYADLMHNRTWTDDRAWAS